MARREASNGGHALESLARLVSLLPVLPLPGEAAAVYGEVRVALETHGERIGGAHARHQQWTRIQARSRSQAPELDQPPSLTQRIVGYDYMYCSDPACPFFAIGLDPPATGRSVALAVAHSECDEERSADDIPDHSVEEPSPAAKSEQELLKGTHDISFREQLLKVRELRIQLTLRPWPIAGPRR